MGGCIDTIMMCVKFGDDPISSLDFSFIGGVPLIKNYNLCETFISFVLLTEISTFII